MPTINGRACVANGRNLLAIDRAIHQAPGSFQWIANVEKKFIKVGEPLCFSAFINNAPHAGALVKGNAFCAMQAKDISGNVLLEKDGNPISFDADGISQASFVVPNATDNVLLFIVTRDMLQNAYYGDPKVELSTVATPLTPAPVDKVFSDGRQVYGRNLALGTAKAFTMTGNGSENNTNYMYSLSSTIAKGTTVTVAFDITSTNTTGVYNVRFPGGAWQGSGALPLFSGTQHQSYTLVTASDYTVDVGVRLDNSTSTITVSNFIISESSTEISWNPAPEDVI